MFTPFRDGLQSTFGGKVRLEDFLPAMEAAAALGVRHFEFGGGALFQAPFFYSARTRSTTCAGCARRWGRTRTCRS
jgi:pyruvate/oxaloacetate carboxyltransferase